MKILSLHSSYEILVPPKLPPEHIDSFKDLHHDQYTDLCLSVIFKKLEVSCESLVNSYYHIHEDVLFFRRYTESEHWLVCITAVHEVVLITSIHEYYSHVEARKCVLALKEICVFPNLYRRIRFVISHSHLYQRTKHLTVRRDVIMQHVLSISPLDKV